MATKKKTPMITQLRTLTFFKENGRWYLECEEWVEPVFSFLFAGTYPLYIHVK